MPDSFVTRRFRSLSTRRASLVLPLAYMLMIVGLSSVPGVIPDDAPVGFQIFNWVPPAVQNLLHIPVYAGLTFLWCWYFVERVVAPWSWFWPLLLTVAFGVFDEWYQSFVPGRYASLTDVLFNGVGALLGLLLFHRLWAEDAASVNDVP